MTPKQTSLYWREWHAAKIACHLEEEDRHHLTREALGEDKSSKDFANEDFDKVLAAFRAISQPDSLDAQLRALNQPRQRLLHGVERTCSPEYRDAIARDKFGTTDLTLLKKDELRQLVITLKARVSSREKQPLNLTEIGLSDHSFAHE
jgi:hypothetical protein